MKTILIISDENLPNSAIIEAMDEWEGRYHTISVTDEKAAAESLAVDDISLLVCDYLSRPDAQIHPLIKLIQKFPYIPSITIIDPERQMAEDFLGNGVSACFEYPFQNDELCRWTDRMIDKSSSGAIRNLPAHSIMQMLSSEKKTCTLKVHTAKGVGYLYIERGELLAAEYDTLQGEKAAYSLITEQCEMAEIKFYNLQKKRDIYKSLMPLVIEAFRIKDEQDSLLRSSDNGRSLKELKHFFTVDTPLEMDSGLSLRLESEEEDMQIGASLIGISQEKYVIVSLGGELQGSPAVAEDAKIVVNYLQSGQICMFKTTVVSQLLEPEQLLFLKYPLVVHYYELRRAARAEIYIPAIMTLASGQRHSGVLLDVSATGCLCQIKMDKNRTVAQLVSPSGPASLFCLFPGVGEEQEIQGIIRNVKQEGNELRVGIEFTALPEAIEKVISNYLESLL